jgi:cbb3-type cytochrome oxidase maturation protein
VTLHVILLLSTLALSLVFLLIFVWAVRDGQFNDMEEPKYEMFRDEAGADGGDDGGRRT